MALAVLCWSTNRYRDQPKTPLEQAVFDYISPNFCFNGSGVDPLLQNASYRQRVVLLVQLNRLVDNERRCYPPPLYSVGQIVENLLRIGKSVRCIILEKVAEFASGRTRVVTKRQSRDHPAEIDDVVLRGISIPDGNPAIQISRHKNGALVLEGLTNLVTEPDINQGHHDDGKFHQPVFQHKVTRELLKYVQVHAHSYSINFVWKLDG